MEKECQNCGKNFKVPPSQIKIGRGKYCSRKCYDNARTTSKICLYCGKIFYLGRKHRNNGINKFCSNKCASLSSKSQVEVECIQCGVKFTSVPSKNSKFCSKKCHNENKKGKFYVPRTEKICEICGNTFIVNHPNHRFCSWQCSCFWLTGIRNKGKNHPRYKGNLKERQYYPPAFFEIRKFIVDLFKNKCFICGKNAKSVHHIDYNKENNCVENLVLLCNSCHAKTNSNREEWIKFFNNEDRKII